MTHINKALKILSAFTFIPFTLSSLSVLAQSVSSTNSSAANASKSSNSISAQAIDNSRFISLRFDKINNFFFLFLFRNVSHDFQTQIRSVK